VSKTVQLEEAVHLDPPVCVHLGQSVSAELPDRAVEEDLVAQGGGHAGVSAAPQQ
jgi:hypothetical protein